MAEGAILVARESVIFAYDGNQVYIHKGRTTVREGHPVLRGREDLFEPLVPTFDLDSPPPRPAAPPGRRGPGRPPGRRAAGSKVA
jgi:hypothetical protein